MQGARGQLLARAALAGHEHREVRTRDPPQELVHAHHRLRLSDEPVDRDCQARLGEDPLRGAQVALARRDLTTQRAVQGLDLLDPSPLTDGQGRLSGEQLEQARRPRVEGALAHAVVEVDHAAHALLHPEGAAEDRA